MLRMTGGGTQQSSNFGSMLPLFTDRLDANRNHNNKLHQISVRSIQQTLLDPKFLEDGAQMAAHLDLNVRDELIEQYFKLGYNHAEILSCVLLLHDQELSLRQLKRILARRSIHGCIDGYSRLEVGMSTLDIPTSSHNIRPL